MRFTIIALATALSTCAAIYPAMAQMVCGSRADIVKQLKGKYGEVRQSVGLQQGRGIIETYANTQTGSWTILVTDTRGRSCLMAAGEAFQVDGREIQGEDS